MHSSLKIKVQASAKSLRNEQKIHYQRLENFQAHGEKPDFFGDDDGKMPDYLSDPKPASSQLNTAATMQSDQDDLTEDIKRVVDSIKSLTNLVSQMNDVVVEQGTIVDRIDYNLEQAARHVKKGNKELQQVRSTSAGERNRGDGLRGQVHQVPLVDKRSAFLLLGPQEVLVLIATHSSICCSLRSVT